MIVSSAAWEWGLYGLLGGLALERKWGIPLPLRVAFGVAAGGLIAVGGLTVEVGVIKIVVLREMLCRVFFVAIGWAWGLMLFPKSEDF